MERKTEGKRLVIYLLLSFGLSWLYFIGFIAGGFRWNGEQPRMQSLLGLGMLVPFMAHLLTRWITKEETRLTGENSLMLGIDFKNGKWKSYLFALLGPWLYTELAIAAVILFYPEIWDPTYYQTLNIGLEVVLIYPFAGIVSGVIASFAALGEEGGWRGYMMPKLISLFGMKKALLIGGVIWGVWHAPLTCVGHNFGTDYPGFPYWGILIMSIFCTVMGVMLTYITVRTGSIWPATFMHAVNNQNPAMLLLLTNQEKVNELPMFSLMVIREIPTALIACIFLYLLYRDGYFKSDRHRKEAV